MNPQESGGTRRDRLLVISRPRPIGRADLDHACAGEPHHVGHAERASDLDKLSPGNDHLFALAQRGQREQDRRGIVVDHEGRVTAEQGGEEAAHQRRPLSSLAGLQVKLEVAVAGADRQRIQGSLRKRSPTEVGVQDHAGRVDHAPQVGGDPRLEPGGHGRVPGGAIGDPVTLGGDLLPDRLDHPVVPIHRHELGVSRLVQEPPYSRQGNRPVSPGIL